MGLAHTCWQLKHDNYASHHSPTPCPRGSYCDPVSFTEFLCPAGTADFNIGNSKVSNCLPCEKGRFSPVPGSSFCPFTCRSGKWTDKVGSSDDSICLAADSDTPQTATDVKLTQRVSKAEDEAQMAAKAEEEQNSKLEQMESSAKSMSERIATLETMNSALLVLLILVILVLVGAIFWLNGKVGRVGVVAGVDGRKNISPPDPFGERNSEENPGDRVIELSSNPMHHSETPSTVDTPLTIPSKTSESTTTTTTTTDTTDPDTEIHQDNKGRRYSFTNSTGVSKWVDDEDA